ncbi:MAG: DUF1566 domain-containing protein [Candidatus Moranbacteria bacterium]|nr:DUF1566 domain-containing protein [Candidatus Moranbacteria bacterium]
MDKGIIVKCHSFYGTTYATSPDVYDGDDYQRFGATALIYDTGELKAWSVDENGVVKWDTQGVNTDGTTRSTDTTMAWKTIGGVTVAADACAKAGGKLPSIEEYRTLSHAWYQGSSNTTAIPLGFIAINYWSSTVVPSSLSSAYILFLSGGVSYFYSNNQANENYVRCVR